MENILSNILIQPKVINEKGLKFLNDYIKSDKQKMQMGVFDPNQKNVPEEYRSKIDTDSRDVKCANCEPILPQLKELLDNIVYNVINPYYGFQIRDCEPPQLLSYDVGGHYKPHIDAEALWVNPDGTKQWKKTIDRDLSTVIFLNNDFEGGYFTFPELRITIRPEPGLLICFPSSKWFLHQVEPVTSGTRHSMVTWMRVDGFKTKEEQDREIEEKYGIKVD